MKMLLMIPVLFALNAQADQDANFEQHKQMMLSFIDKRIAKLQEEKACISSATNKEDAKACRKKAKSQGESMKAEHKANREQWKADRKKRKLDKASQNGAADATPTP
ncbi:MAG: hypothetical protein ACOYL6_05925 [Bacteriovoracaceae bacterium]